MRNKCTVLVSQLEGEREREKGEEGRGGERKEERREKKGEGKKRKRKEEEEREGKKRSVFFFFNDTATTEIYTLSLHDALPISKIISFC